MVSGRRIKQRVVQAQAVATYRARVLAVILAAPGPITGRDIAGRAGLEYRQVVDALQALHSLGRITRHGRKSTARWSMPAQPDPDHPALMLDRILRSFPRD